MDKIGFGILGAGMISGIHADALRKSAKGKMVAVCDVRQENARKLAETYAPDAKVYSDFDQMLADPCFTQVVASRDEYTPEYLVDFERTKLAANGLNSTMAASAFSAAMSGSVGSFYREEGEEYNIRVRYPKYARTSVEDIGNIPVYTPAGTAVRIKCVRRADGTREPHEPCRWACMPGG
jgi:multidrug efflux pump subunit AcrB